MNAEREIAELSRSIVFLGQAGLSAAEFRSQVLGRLGRMFPIDAVWWAATDPATLLFTSAHRVGLPAESADYFIDNEFLANDVNKWTTLARDRAGVGSLSGATSGRLTDSPRYRDVFAPLGLGDELRAVLRIQGEAWGLICLHQAAGRAYTAEEAGWLRRVAPSIAAGMRIGMLTELSSGIASDDPAAPGVVLVAVDGSIVSSSANGQAWLAELTSTSAATGGVPLAIQTVAARLRATDGDPRLQPRLRLRTQAGRWAVIHASWIEVTGDAVIAIIIEAAAPTEVAPLIMLAYGLTPRERDVIGLISRGLSTSEIADELSMRATLFRTT